MNKPYRHQTEIPVHIHETNNWTDEHLWQFELDEGPSGNPVEWAIRQVTKAMNAAGEAFVRNNPDLFRSHP